MLWYGAIFAAEAEDDPRVPKPNIIFIMADDQGWGDLGCYGSPELQTPNLDQMAREGIRFTDCYSGSAVCAPTRCVLMTGMHPGHATRRDNTAKASFDEFEGRPLVPLSPSDVTVAAALKSAGYQTGGFGKWGLGNPGSTGSPDLHGFDDFFGYLDQVHAHDYYTDHLVRNGGETVTLKGNENGKRQVYSHDVIFDESLDFVREHQRSPFFLYLPICLPHGEYEIPSDAPYSGKSWPQSVKNYAAMIGRIDRDVGRLIALLKELGIDKNTIVFYTSDNGPNSRFIKPLKSAGPFRGIKRQLREGGLRAPMIVRWPGKVPAGKTSPFVWGHVDFFATACDIARASAPEKTDGVSVLPTLLGKTQTPRPPLYWEIYSPFQQAVRLGQWKGFRNGTKEPLELYHLAEDPGERENLATQNPKIVRQIETVMNTSHRPSRFWPTVAKPSQKKRKGNKKTKGTPGLKN